MERQHCLSIDYFRVSSIHYFQESLTKYFVAGAEEPGAAAAQQTDSARGSEGRGARRQTASMLCRDPAFDSAGQLVDATTQADREAGHAGEGAMQGAEPAGMSSSADSGPAGGAAAGAAAGGGPRCQVRLANRLCAPLLGSEHMHTAQVLAALTSLPCGEVAHLLVCLYLRTLFESLCCSCLSHKSRSTSFARTRYTSKVLSIRH